MAVSGNTSPQLEGTGLQFGNANNTNLTIVDTNPGITGTVTVSGFVTLGQKTMTTMNFDGAKNNADELVVENGELALNGAFS